MKFTFQMESVLIAISGVLFALLLVKLLYTLRSILLWRVNCWFCNNNFWVKYLERNYWTCPSCEQYNGFTKDGDYNRVITAATDTSSKTPKVFCSSPKNGLCKMCNINQQLKIAQLANFIPMNERNFDEEVEGYRLQLEKAYKLCSPCRNVLQTKLHKEKETLLGSKLLQSRSPDKKAQKQETQNKTVHNIINKLTNYIAALVMLLVSYECYKNMMKHDSLSQTVTNVSQIISSLLERVVAIIKMKMIMTFPDLDIYFNEVDSLYKEMASKYLSFNVEFEYNDEMNLKAQEVLAGFACSIQILVNMWADNKLTYSFFVDLLWVMFLTSSVLYHYLTDNHLIITVVKLSIISTMLLLYGTMKSTKGNKSRAMLTPKKNLANKLKSLIDEEDHSMETDDDVSLCQFGLHNLSESSNESPKQLNNTLNNGRAFIPRHNESIWSKSKNDTTGQLNQSLINGRSFTPQSNNSIWAKPKLNSTFCVNSLLAKTPSSVSETVFVKPMFNKCQNFENDHISDSDSSLDQSISSLCISSQKKSRSNKANSIFSLRKFTATPSFAVPTLLNRKPLISPSKLGHSTSWVAGGYWGSDERQLFSVNGSRSSSQSSGFESQTSSLNNQRNVFSQPSSREESICGESDRTVLDQFSNCSMSTKGPHNFSRVSSPVFPQMQYNGHVHIPQPRFAQSQNMFAQHQQQYDQNSMFKAPSRSRMNNRQANAFLSR